MIRLEFSIGLDYEVLTPTHFVFNFAAAQTLAQRLVVERLTVNGVPLAAELLRESFANRLLRLNAPPGSLRVAYAATVDINHMFEQPTAIHESALDQLPLETLLFLRASRYCQSDQLVQFAHAEFGHLPRGYARVEAIRSWVQQHTQFVSGVSTVATTALDTLNDQRGVCRDFAHLMIALCRGLNVPARFVTGLDYGANPALGPSDFHAYVEVWLGNRWYLFDPTGISPTTGLMRLATGRDAADVSFCTAFGSVREAVPQVIVDAVEDPQRGLMRPQPTTLAVSTAGIGEPLRELLPHLRTAPQMVAHPVSAPSKPAPQYS